MRKAGQGEVYLGALAGFGFDPDLAVATFNDAFAQRQADAGA